MVGFFSYNSGRAVRDLLANWSPESSSLDQPQNIPDVEHFFHFFHLRHEMDHISVDLNLDFTFALVSNLKLYWQMGSPIMKCQCITVAMRDFTFSRRGTGGSRHVGVFFFPSPDRDFPSLPSFDRLSLRGYNPDINSFLLFPHSGSPV